MFLTVRLKCLPSSYRICGICVQDSRSDDDKCHDERHHGVCCRECRGRENYTHDLLCSWVRSRYSCCCRSTRHRNKHLLADTRNYWDIRIRRYFRGILNYSNTNSLNFSF